MERWHYDEETGLYFQMVGENMAGVGLTFNELAEHLDYVPGHDDGQIGRIEWFNVIF
jgi:hypothetical protein